VAALNSALDDTDDLSALVKFEGVIGSASIDFKTMLTAGDARTMNGYLIDDDEEPIGCLLIEQANSALWHQ
jgi:hypothetical protein